MSRADDLDELMQELARHIDRRVAEVAGGRLPIALFIFADGEAHALSTGEWNAVRRALADWTEEDRSPATTFSLKEH